MGREKNAAATRCAYDFVSSKNRDVIDAFHSSFDISVDEVEQIFVVLMKF